MLTAELTAPYTPQYFFEEVPTYSQLSLESLSHLLSQLQGLADAVNDTGVTYKQLLQVQMFPELIKASCTMFGAWGPAIAQCAGELRLDLHR